MPPAATSARRGRVRGHARAFGESYTLVVGDRMPQERQAQATHDQRTLLLATSCMVRSALGRSGELARAPPVLKRRRNQQHAVAVFCRIPPSRSILRRRPGRRSHTPAKPPLSPPPFFRPHDLEKGSHNYRMIVTTMQQLWRDCETTPTTLAPHPFALAPNFSEA